MKESYDDDEEEQEGPKSSFGVYLAEGDALYKQGEYKKAIESYTLALELQDGDKFCLVARSKCYLKLGDPQSALKDAEVALQEDKEFNKGLYQKAEALYSMGDFEYSLMYYHRGHKLRPELDEFRLGIQKAQEAIDNSIGNAANVKLENKGDMSFFNKQDDMGKKTKGYSKPVGLNKQKPMVSNRNKETKAPAPSNKTVKQLLGELYEDKEYLEKLMKDTDFINSSANRPIHDLVKDGLNYLDTRTEFWRQQKPLYARKKEKQNVKAKKKKSGVETAKFIVKSLEEIDEALANGEPELSFKKGQSTLKNVEGINEMDLPNKMEIIANLHSCMGNALLDMDKPEKALKHHNKDLDVSKKNKIDDGVSRALDNIGRAYARMGKFEKAIESWNEKLPLTKTALENTWLHHEIGRCHLEIAAYKEAREFGEKSLSAAKEAEDEVWQLNASVLISQADVKLGDYQQAISSFNKALELATSLNDEAAKNAINKALDDLQSKVEEEKEMVETGSIENGTTEPETADSDTVETGTAKNETVETGTVENETVETATDENGTVETGSVENETAEQTVDSEAEEKNSVKDTEEEEKSLTSKAEEPDSATDSVIKGSLEDDKDNETVDTSMH